MVSAIVDTSSDFQIHAVTVPTLIAAWIHTTKPGPALDSTANSDNDNTQRQTKLPSEAKGNV